MPIWSLTQERFDKLKRNIGDREADHTKLTKTSTKELWMRDLDDFLEEWRFQLDDEQKRSKKLASMGRRASTKLRIGGKNGSKKRKHDVTDDDSEFEASKPKKTAPAPKKNSDMFNWLTVKEGQDNADSKPAFKPVPMSLDGTNEQVSETHHLQKDPKSSSQPAKSVTRNGDHAGKKDDDESEDMFVQIAKEAKRPSHAEVSRLEARLARAKKPVKYNAYPNEDDDDDDDEADSDRDEDMLEKVSSMVKGLPQNESTRSRSKTGLESFHTVNTSSAGSFQDEPKERQTIGEGPSQASKQNARPKNQHIVKAKNSKTTSEKPPSPAAKAYAAKLAKARGQGIDAHAMNSKTLSKPDALQIKSKRRKSPAEEDAQSVSAIADDLLETVQAQEEAGDSRPRLARRAAASNPKSKYVVDDDSDDFSGEDEDDAFEMESSD